MSVTLRSAAIIDLFLIITTQTKICVMLSSLLSYLHNVTHNPMHLFILLNILTIRLELIFYEAISSGHEWLNVCLWEMTLFLVGSGLIGYGTSLCIGASLQQVRHFALANNICECIVRLRLILYIGMVLFIVFSYRANILGDDWGMTYQYTALTMTTAWQEQRSVTC